ncbi:hypothetical protein D3C76_1310330 [compost metagenome]
MLPLPEAGGVLDGDVLQLRAAGQGVRSDDGSGGKRKSAVRTEQLKDRRRAGHPRVLRSTAQAGAVQQNADAGQDRPEQWARCQFPAGLRGR